MEDLLGIPFVEGGRTLQGLDCWGLVMECARRDGHALPDPFTAADCAHAVESANGWVTRWFGDWRRIYIAQRGCIAAFAHVDGAAFHVGYLLDHDRFLHALRGCGVVQGRLSRDPWNSHLTGLYEYYVS